MIDQELLVRSVTDATTRVFSTMLDMEVKFCGTVSEARACDSGGISLVGITGEWGGSGVFSCSPMLATLLCTRMLGSSIDIRKSGIDEEVLDVVAELANMILGNIKNGFEPITGPLAISVPTLMHGRNIRFRTACSLRGAALLFSSEGQRFEVCIGLAPVSERSGVRCRIPVLGLAHM